MTGTGHRRRAVLGALVLAASGGGAAAAFGLRRDRDAPPRRGALPPATAEVTRATLTEYVDATGEIGYGESVPLRYTPTEEQPPPGSGEQPPPGSGEQPPAGAGEQPPAGAGLGLLTWLPAVGSIVERGAPLFRVDERPVALLFGPLPLYRPLRTGDSGRDVRQLEENLRALGQTGLTVDDRFTAATATAVRRWQRRLGVAETGTVAPGQVVYAPGPVRIAGHTLRVGDPATGEVLRYTGTLRTVTLDLEPDQRAYAKVGTAVTVTLPEGTTVAGKVTGAGPAAGAADGAGAAGDAGAASGQPGAAAVRVTIGFADQSRLDDTAPGPVRVRFVARERANVLTVPVTALLVLAEGGYGVQVVDGTTASYVAVETGLFAQGRVEITGGDLRPGMLVGVPK
jgi:peptidoglycan hydrolase-like protein with peptidoglycan-binding domain